MRGGHSAHLPSGSALGTQFRQPGLWFPRRVPACDPTRRSWTTTPPQSPPLAAPAHTRPPAPRQPRASCSSDPPCARAPRPSDPVPRTRAALLRWGLNEPRARVARAARAPRAPRSRARPGPAPRPIGDAAAYPPLICRAFVFARQSVGPFG